MSILTKLVIPSSCNSFSEMADYLVEYNIALTQDTLVNMTSCVLESFFNEDASNKRDGIIYFDEITESINKSKDAAIKFFDKVEEKFKKEVETNKSIYKLNKRMVNNIKPNQVFRSIHSFDMLENIRPAENCMKFLKEVCNKFEEQNSDKSACKKIAQEMHGKLFTEISGLESDHLGDIDSSYKEYIIGKKIKIDKNWLDMNYDEVKSVVISGHILDILKEMKSAEMNIYNNALQALENMDKELGNSIHVDYYSLIMNCLNTMHKCNGIILDVHHRKMIEYKGIVTSLNIRSTNETVESEGSADYQDGKFDSTPQELAKTASQNQVSEPTNTSSAPIPVAEGAKNFLKKLGSEAGIAAGAGAAGVVGTYLASKAVNKVDELLEKRKRKKEEDNKSEEKH